MVRPSGKYEIYKTIDLFRLKEILEKIKSIKVALIGDICLDVYWRADMKKSELSRETPHYNIPVVEEWMSPGAGGNVCSNLNSLGASEIFPIGLIGNDWRGNLLKNILTNKKSLNLEGLFESNDRITESFCKPLIRGISDVEYEEARIDFLNYKQLSNKDENKLINFLEKIVKEVDITCVSDQNINGCVNETVRKKIIELGKKGHRIIVDSRYRISQFTDVILKPNEVEGWQAVYEGDIKKDISLNKLLDTARLLSVNNKSEVCMTIGSKGCIFTNGVQAIYVPSYEVGPPLDICGAGDTFLATFACALAAGAEKYEAALIANMASDVTIKKIGTTETVSAKEIEKRYKTIFMGRA